jgi:hypothetical protein
MRIAAGILMIIGGLGAPLGANLAVALMFVFGLPLLGLVGLLTVLAWAIMVMSFLGAYFTFRGRRFRLALAGAVVSALAVPHVPGLLAVVFVAIREGEFEGRALKGSAEEGQPEG